MAMETTMYDTLLQLPLFQGLCKEDFTSIIERVKLHFQTYKQRDTIVEQGETCSKLVFLLNGEVALKFVDTVHGYIFSETLKAPYIIEPYSLFGMSTCYTASYQAHTDAQILTIDKAYVFTELNNYEIFRLNYLNILSNRIQIAHQKLWHNHIGTLNEKFNNFLLARSLTPQGEKMLQITMEDLAKLINETRINVSRMLNERQKQGLLELRRKAIYIPDLEKLSESLI